MLGPARGAGNEMVQWILKANGQVVPHHSIRPLHLGELTSPSEQSKHQSFDVIWPKPEIEDTVDATGRLLNQSPAYDRMINVEVRIQLDNAAASGKVKRQTLRADGQMTGKYNTNPYHNSVLDEVDFAYGQVCK